MKLRPLILIVFLVVLPIMSLALAAWKIAEGEQVVVEKRYRVLMEQRLNDLNITVGGYFSDVQREVQKVLEVDSFNPDDLRSVLRSQPQLLQTFVLNPDGELIYPDPTGILNSNEREFLLHSSRMFSGQDLKSAVQNSESRRSQQNSDQSTQPNSRSSPPLLPQVSQNRFPESTDVHEVQQEAIPKGQSLSVGATNLISSLAQTSSQDFQQSSGWFVWYWDRGLNLISWQRRPSGHIVGAALERARWMSDLIARLPETVVPDQTAAGQFELQNRVRLINSSADLVYQWGTFEPDLLATPFCEVSLVEPLNSWRLQCFVPETQLLAGTGRGVYLGLFSSLLAVGVVVAITALFLIRDYSRDMQEARQQVSFVNQVSHELRTPLTNIRMYAELLESDLQHLSESDRSKPQERLNVIVSEGGRLTRLIGNVLTFAQQKRNNLQVHREGLMPDEVIQKVVNRFRPALDDQQVTVDVDVQAVAPLMLDPDVLEQVLGNLINNVEKYAASGGSLKITGKVNEGMLEVNVIDAGPGIPPQLRSAVFQPFVRGSNDVNYAAGTGIGLSIARDLCRLHGGDLKLKKAEAGCWFQATFKCEAC